MRALIIVPLCLAAAACSGGGEEGKVTQKAARMEAGQWETSFEVTSFRSTDKSTPVLKAAVGDKETGSACITDADGGAPPAAIFAGPGYECSYKDSYLRAGRINATLDCRRKGIDGSIMMNASGTFTGTTFEGTVDAASYLPGSGDFALTRKIGGRKTGAACPAPAPEGDAKGGGKAGG
ncbi:MAG TPA: DUF3617 family protein [Allosphingosinicella sp.]